MSNFLYYASTFDADNFLLGRGQSVELDLIKLDFTIKTIIGGERYIYFVTPDDKIVNLTQNNDNELLGWDCLKKEPITTTVVSKLENSEKSSSLVLQGNAVLVRESFPTLVPSEYHRDMYSIFIVDRVNNKIAHFKNKTIYNFEEGIALIATGPLANATMVLTRNKKLYTIDKNLISETSEDFYVCCGSGGGNVFVAQNNRIFLTEPGSYIYQGLTGGVNDLSSGGLTYVPTYLESESKIVDVKAGYYHVMFLLADGSVHCAGYNNLNQCSLTSGNSSSHPLSKLPLNVGFGVKIGCFSRGNWIMNANHEVFLIAEMFQSFSKQTTEYPQVQKRDLQQLFFKALKDGNIRGDIPNEICGSGWQCAIFHSTKNQTKSLKYFNEQLLRFTTMANFSDIQII